MSPAVLVPFQMVLLGALSAPLLDGTHPLCWFHFDEGNKICDNPVAAEVLTEIGTAVGATTLELVDLS